MKAYRVMIIACALMAFGLTSMAATTVVPRDTVVPVILDTTLSSATSSVGDTFIAHHTGINGGGFPENTKFTGEVESVTRASLDRPGQIGVRFVSAELPDGTTVPISGSLTALDASSVKSDPSTGRLVATTTAKKADHKFIAYGAGAGLVIGQLLGKKPFLGAVLGAAAGYLYGQKKGEAAVGQNVKVPAGTQFGVLLGEDVALAEPGYTAVGGITGMGSASGPGWRVKYRSLRPMMSRNDLLVPLRYTMDWIGTPFDYDASTRTVRVNRGDTQILHTVGTNLLYSEGQATRLGGSSRIINGAIYVPAGFIETVTGRTTYWSPKSRVLRIE